MDDIIEIDGVKYRRIEEPKKDSPFDIKRGDFFNYIDCLGGVSGAKLYESSDGRIENANACKDTELMKQRALHETLDRLLWKASIEAGGDNAEWDGAHRHYAIALNRGEFRPFYTQLANTKYSCVYFPTEKSASDAIENIIKPFMKAHPDFEW